MSRKYTATGTALLLVMICAAGVGQEQQSETIKIPARPDDLVIGFARILEPQDGNWIFEIKDNKLFLNGLLYHPTISVYAEKYAEKLANRPEPSAADRERMKIETELLTKSRSIYRTAGIDSAASMLRSSAFVDSVQVYDGYLGIYFRARNGNVYVQQLWSGNAQPSSKHKSPRDVILDRIEDFRRILARGASIRFGTSTNTVISHQQREFVRTAMKVLMDNGPDSLTPAQRQDVDMDAPGFRKDYEDLQQKGK